VKDSVSYGELPPQHDKVAVAVTYDGRGMCLKALVDFDVADVILQEKAAIAVGGGGATREENAAQCVAAFQELPLESRGAILGLYCPDWPVLGLEEMEAGLGEDERRFLHVLAVNGVSLPDARRGLFATSSRANHSCRPNAAFCVRESGELALLAISEIDEGEEITVSYLSEADLLVPRSRRQRMLRNWGFECDCSRCSADFDDVRSMRCGECGFGELRCEHGGGYQACTACGDMAKTEDVRWSEGRWWKRFRRLPAGESGLAYEFRARRYDTTGRLPSLRPPASPRKLQRAGWMAETLELYRTLSEADGPCPMVIGQDRRTWARFGHWLAGGLADVVAEAHLWRGEYEEAAAAAQARRRFVSQALGGGSLSYEAAMAAAIQGTALVLMGEAKRGQRVLRDALRIAETTRWQDNELVVHIRSQLRLLEDPEALEEAAEEGPEDPWHAALEALACMSGRWPGSRGFPLTSERELGSPP